LDDTTNTKKGGKRGIMSRRHDGSSMVEMLVALIVLAVVLISMVGMFLISRTAIYTKEDETANALALKYLERCEELDYSVIKAAAPPGTGYITPLDYPTSGKYQVTANAISADTYSATVEVTVTWSNGNRPVVLQRVISAGGHKNVGELN